MSGLSYLRMGIEFRGDLRVCHLDLRTRQRNHARDPVCSLRLLRLEDDDVLLTRLAACRARGSLLGASELGLELFLVRDRGEHGDERVVLRGGGSEAAEQAVAKGEVLPVCGWLRVSTVFRQQSLIAYSCR